MDPREVGCTHDGPHRGVGEQRVARLSLGSNPQHMLHDLVVDRFVDEQPGSRSAHLTRVIEDRPCRRAGSLGDVGIGEDHIRRLATELRPDPLEIRLRGVLHEFGADRGRTGKGHDVDIHMAPEGLAGNLPVSVHDVEDPIRNAGFQRQFGKEQG